MSWAGRVGDSAPWVDVEYADREVAPMPKAKQLTVSCDNRPGTLAHVARVLGDAKVNILTFLTTTSGAEGSVQVVVDNVNKAKKALDGAGLSSPRPMCCM